MRTSTMTAVARAHVIPRVSVLPAAFAKDLGLVAVPITDGHDPAAITPARRRCNPLFDGLTVRIRAAASEVACIQVLVRASGALGHGGRSTIRHHGGHP